MSTDPLELGGMGQWTIQEAEELIASLSGVSACRIVARPGGEILEVHVLTSEEVSAKQTVRNIESALLAHFDLTLDHRKISVARSSIPEMPMAPREGSITLLGGGPPQPTAPKRDGRIVFRGHRVQSEEAHRISVRVEVDWNGATIEGEGAAADLAKPRLEASANATLRALETILEADRTAVGRGTPVTLALDGVKVVEAFDRKFVLVSVNALTGRQVIGLAGSAAADDNLDRSVVLATLQATDRWIRGRLEDSESQ